MPCPECVTESEPSLPPPMAATGDLRLPAVEPRERVCSECADWNEIPAT